MTAEQLVPTLDTCRRLRDAGFPQDTVFAWVGDLPYAAFGSAATRDITYGVWLRSAYEGTKHVVCAAPTLAEVLAQLPRRLDLDGESCDLMLDWCADGPRVGFVDGYAVWRLAECAWRGHVEAAALLWLKLAEAGHIKPAGEVQR